MLIWVPNCVQSSAKNDIVFPDPEMSLIERVGKLPLQSTVLGVVFLSIGEIPPYKVGWLPAALILR